jgi:osmotically-inducible protein OsmY
MKTDSQLQKDVRQALEWDPSITHELIGVTVSDSIVTLSGSVPSYFEKTEAESVTQKVWGVKAIVENIEVKPPYSYSRDDSDIAKAIVNQFKWSFRVPSDSVKVLVKDGRVTLRGEVAWDYQRSAAQDCIKDLLGVMGVTNDISIKTKSVDPSKIQEKIEEALKSEAKQEAGNIKVKVSGNTVTLSGDVNSFAERNNAKWAAWGAPGVTMVKNDLRINDY